jgi:hypothetical protein
MDILGHALMSTTMDIYGHVMPSIQRAATAKLDGLLNDTCNADKHAADEEAGETTADTRE